MAIELRPAMSREHKRLLGILEQLYDDANRQLGHEVPLDEFSSRPLGKDIEVLRKEGYASPTADRTGSNHDGLVLRKPGLRVVEEAREKRRGFDAVQAAEEAIFAWLDGPPAPKNPEQYHPLSAFARTRANDFYGQGFRREVLDAAVDSLIEESQVEENKKRRNKEQSYRATIEKKDDSPSTPESTPTLAAKEPHAGNKTFVNGDVYGDVSTGDSVRPARPSRADSLTADDNSTSDNATWSQSYNKKSAWIGMASLVVAIISVGVPIWLATGPFDKTTAKSSSTSTSLRPTATTNTISQEQQRFREYVEPADCQHLNTDTFADNVDYKNTDKSNDVRLNGIDEFYYQVLPDSSDEGEALGALELRLYWDITDDRANHTLVKISGVRGIDDQGVEGKLTKDARTTLQNSKPPRSIPSVGKCGAWQKAIFPQSTAIEKRDSVLLRSFTD